MPENRTKNIIYIMGHSRSGSTILNTILGSEPQTMAASEVGATILSGVVNNEFCSCGQRFMDCEFWAPIGKSISSELNISPNEFMGDTLFFQNWRSLVFSRRISANRRKLEEYCRINERLYDQIFAQSNAETVVDASKSPMRYWHLRNIKGYNFYLIHIVRDPRGVCWSQLHSLKKDLASGIQHDFRGIPYIKTIKSLYLNALLSEKVKRLNPARSITINYDELAKSPAGPLNTIEVSFGFDTKKMLEPIENNIPLTPFHVAAGNRLRMNNHIIVSHDETWRTGLSKAQYILITLLTLPLILRYKFKL